MRIGFHNPFLRAPGGGDKYLFTILEEALRLPDTEAVVFSPRRPTDEDWEKLSLDIDSERIGWQPGRDPVVSAHSRELDLLVALANDVPVLNRAARGVAIVQFPFRRRERPGHRLAAGALGLVGRRRAPRHLASYQRYIAYSQFARHWIGRRLGVEAEVIAPPVDAPSGGRRSPKRRLILSVGRFLDAPFGKHQAVLVEAFRELHERAPEASGWELHLAGSADRERGTAGLLDRLRRLGAGLPVSFHVNARRTELEELYGAASLLWHAAGFGVDARRRPEWLEHFGIAIVEGMAHGAVPLVVGEGGSAEIVRDGHNGLHWRTRAELVERTAGLIAEPELTSRLRERARADAAGYGKDRFLAAARDLILAPAPSAILRR